MPKIALWMNGGFQSAEQPDWWDAEWDRVANEKPSFGMGEAEKVMIEVRRIERGWMVFLEHGGFLTTIWAPSEADMLDFMTTRAPAWMALPPLIPTE